MRPFVFIIAPILAAYFVQGAYLQRKLIVERDDGTSTSIDPTQSQTSDAPVSEGPTSLASPSSTPPETSTSLTQVSSNSSPMTTATPTSLESMSMSTTTPISRSTSSPVPTLTSQADVLPLQPKLTPAIGIAGVLLLISGLVLCLIGIKHRATQIFISTTLVVALSIEVLIVYVMAPPVSNALQGGYLVAGVGGGAVVGGVAIIFKDMTEGLGCLLGGFCFAMWLLTTSPGGLIQDQTGRIILIAALCAVAWSLSFSHWTRNIGIIICTAFAGAMTFVLGVDFLSGAGLKEFWIYIWNLNANEFPIGTTTYPLTSGMKVEVGVTVIVCALGVMSQIKLWKIVRERRALKDAERLQDEQDRDLVEAERGRDLEEQNRQDRVEWENAYGDKSGAHTYVDSGFGSTAPSTRKGSVNVDAGDTIERQDSNTPEEGYAPEEDLAPHIAKPAPVIMLRSASVKETTSGQGRVSFDRPVSLSRLSSLGADHISPALKRFSSAMGSYVARSTVNEDADSRDPFGDRVQLNNPESFEMTTRAGQVGPSEPDSHDQDEEDDISIDDRASSIAATAAEDPDIDGLSIGLKSRASWMYLSASARNSAIHVEGDPVQEHDDEALPFPQKPSPVGQQQIDMNLQLPPSPGLHNSQTPTSSKGFPFPSRRESTVDSVEGGSQVENLGEHLPRKVSKAASVYRTTEWAKEAGRAEIEPLEEIQDHTLDAVQVDMISAAEAARAEENNATVKPVVEQKPTFQPESESEFTQSPDVQDFSTVVLPRPALQAQRPTSKQSLASLKRPTSAISKQPSSAHLSTSDLISAQRSVTRHSSSATLAAEPSQATGSYQTYTIPLAQQPLFESPLEDPTIPPPHLPRSKSKTNLLDERNERLRRRVTSTSLNEFSSPPPPPTNTLDDNLIPAPIEDPLSSSSEDMTLAERRALVLQQNHPSPLHPTLLPEQRQSTLIPSRRQSTQALLRQPSSSTRLPPSPPTRRTSSATLTGPHNPLLARASSTLSLSSPSPAPQPQPQSLIYDSHQPRRTSTHDANKSAQTWSAWRSSQALDQSARTSVLNTDSQMNLLLRERQQADVDNKRLERERDARQEEMDRHMRMGGLQDAHREALRRMQGVANERAR